ncbi:MAG: sigma-54 dependent transcriptional regulator [Bacteroidales bacterium]|nr:sigma-54 dependent transcriptional regulator [Bacteroidales bacterium]
MKKIFIIDDDTFFCDILKKHLENNNYIAEAVFRGKDAINWLKNNSCDLVLCDYSLPDITGLELLQHIKAENLHLPVVIMTAYAEVRMAVKLMKMGADDYVTKPIQHEEILLLMDSLLQAKKQSTKKSHQKTFYTNGEFIVGESKKIKQILNFAKKVAPTDMSVIISGETGTGKEYIARFIHENSFRRDKPFMAIDCGAIPKDLANSELFGHVKGSFTGAIIDKSGIFQKADGGTLFLDEVANLSHDVQQKLLRAIQERMVARLGDDKAKPVDIRIIAASNEDLMGQVNENKFREDLYHRLNEFKIDLPPIRERVEDLQVFVKHFIKMANQQLNRNIIGLTPEAHSIVINYPWYGNLRELKNVIKRAVLLAEGDEIDSKCFPAEIIFSQEIGREDTNSDTASNSNSKLKNASSEIEKQLIIETIHKAGYNKSQAARLLNIDRKTLYNKIKLYDIKL